MAVLVFLVELIAVVAVTVFLALAAALLLIIAKFLAVIIEIITPLSWLLLCATVKFGNILQYNVECFSNLTRKVYHKIIRKPTNGEESDLQTDAIPDMPKSQTQHQGKNLNSNLYSQAENGDAPDDDLNVQSKFPEQTFYSSRNKNDNDSTSFKSSDSEEKANHEFSHNPKKMGNSEPPFSMNKTSVVVNGGVGIQFGNNITNNNTVNYVWNGVNKRKQDRSEQNCSFEKTVEIQELLKNEMELNPKHLDFLSGYLGKQWKDIGKTLGFTSGELDAAEERGGTHKDKAFEMLKRWCQKKGNNATVGKLTSSMWKCKIPAAIEAVQKLSSNIKHMI